MMYPRSTRDYLPSPTSCSGASMIFFQLSTKRASSTPSTTRWSALNVTSCQSRSQQHASKHQGICISLSFPRKRTTTKIKGEDDTHHEQPRLESQRARVPSPHRNVPRPPFLPVDINRANPRSPHRTNRQLSCRRYDWVRRRSPDYAHITQRDRAGHFALRGEFRWARSESEGLQVGNLGREGVGGEGVDGGEEGRVEAS